MTVYAGFDAYVPPSPALWPALRAMGLVFTGSYLVAPFTLLHLKTGAAAVAVRPSGGTLLDRDRQGRQPSHLSVWFMGTPSTETKVMVPVKVCPSADMVIVNA